MASFSFAAGNARKLARIPLYAAGRIVTAFTRRRDTWVFGCGAGIGDGALALWHEARSHGHTAVWLVAEERDADDARRLGIPTLRTYSVAGFLATARAGVVVVTHGFGDVNRYALGGAFVAQLWHGIPLKRIGLDSAETTRTTARLLSRLIAVMFRGAARRIALIPSASELVRGRLESAFGLSQARVAVTGEPRVDVLSAGDPGQRRRVARERLVELVGDLPSTVVLYAPTWRDGEDDPAVPDADEWHRLHDRLEAIDAVLLVRSHPLGAGEYVPPFRTDRIRLLGSDLVRDVTPMLPGMDALVTDYSSLAFDAGLVPLPVVYFAPDAVEYGARRGFYGRYADVVGETWATGWRDVLDTLDGISGDTDVRAALVTRSAALSERVHDFRDGRNAERVYGEIIRRRRIRSGTT